VARDPDRTTAAAALARRGQGAVRGAERGPRGDALLPRTAGRAESDRLVDRIEARFEEQGFGLRALELLSTSEFIGFTGLNPMPELPEGVLGAGGQEVGWRR
jgi:hypothetical protein